MRSTGRKSGKYSRRTTFTTTAIICEVQSATLRSFLLAIQITYLLNDRFVREYNLAAQLRRACESIRNELDAALSAHNVNYHQMSMLVAVSSGAARSPAEISRLLGVDPAVVTRALGRFEARQLIVRLRNQTDRRTVHVLLTPTGEQVVAQLCEIASRVLEGRLGRFSKIEFEKLGNLLIKLTTA